MPGQDHLGRILRGRDIFLCHSGVDKPWVATIAERIEAVPYLDRHLGVVFDKWDFVKGKNVVTEIDEHIDNCRFIALIVSKAMLASEWATMERTIAVWSDPSGRKGRVIPLLIENVDMPASLRIRNWIDFREPDNFEEAFIELVNRLTDTPTRRGRGSLRLINSIHAFPQTPAVISASNEPDAIEERLVANLLPVTELPRVVQVADTDLRKKAEIKQYAGEKRPPPFILRNQQLYTFSDLHDIENPLQQDVPEIDTTRSFRRGLKAECMQYLPTQLLWHRTLAGTRGVQELATRAWNLSVALMYKARIIPWRLADVVDGSCFVGVSFFHPDNEPNTIRTSVAQAFTHDGNGFVLQGRKFTWTPTRTERAPHLDQTNARELVKLVLDTYEKEVGGKPYRFVLHKTSRYSDAERLGFEEGLQGIRDVALVTLGRRGITCLRPGTKPVLRGTAVDFGNRCGLVYTTGYIPYLRCYPGFRIPQPLEVTENWGALSFREVAADLVRLTKLNWNTAAFCCVEPITIAFSRRVGEILKVANTDTPSRFYRDYM